MLLSWKISNFKSIRDPVILPLRPLTVVCGPNSSGKSTLLKSILVAAQSLGSSAWQEPLVLNGRLVQLGHLEDVFHHDSGLREIVLGFRMRSIQGAIITVDAVIEGHTGSNTRSPERMRARVRHSRLHVEQRGGEVEIIELQRKPSDVALSVMETHETLPPLKGQLSSGFFDYEIVHPTKVELAQGQLREEALSASLTNFIPGRILIRTRPRVREIAQQMQQVIDVVLSFRSDESSGGAIEWNQPIDEAVRLAFELVRVPRSYREASAYQDIMHRVAVTSGLTPRQLREMIEPLNRWGLVHDLARRLSGVIPELQQRISDGRGRDETALEVRPFPAQYGSLLTEVKRQLGEQILYLGPLRDDPRAVYAIPLLPNQRDVGLKGEYTAAMLDLYGDEVVEYPLPPVPDGGKLGSSFGPLAEAVKLWLDHVGMAEGLKTLETAKVGYHLNIRAPGLDRDLDLMSVGVGVSQVLPTIVAALLAPKGTLLLIEQPEVHLHPSVQSALGDFFLGIIRCGKQCLVETHSEHVINRLRRRIVEDRSGETHRSIGIYFVERQEGVSQFREVQPNEYGAILDWPKGFFDEAEQESADILRESMERRRESAQRRRESC